MLMVILGAGASYDSSPDFVPNSVLGMDGGADRGVRLSQTAFFSTEMGGLEK